MGKPTLKFAVSHNWKVYQLANTIDMQVRAIKADIEMGQIQDTEKAKAYVSKMQEILAMKYFQRASWSMKTVRSLNKQISSDCKDAKVLMEKAEESLQSAKNCKLQGVQLSLMDIQQGGKVPPEKVYEIDARYANIDETIQELEKECRLRTKTYRTLRFLQGMLNCSTFFDSLYKENDSKSEKEGRV